jgi:hypothetical protein
MKKLKLIALTAIAFVIITSMIFVSCQKQNEFISTSNGNGNNPTNINKRLTLSEENGVELLSEANTYLKKSLFMMLQILILLNLMSVQMMKNI